MATAVEINTLRRKTKQALIRFDLRKLSPADLIDLRHAWEAMTAISDARVGDKRGFIAVARGHGYDQDLCHVDPKLFLPWHRSYVYALEKRLTSALQNRRKDPGCVITLPYWDWRKTDAKTDDADGIPKALSDDTYVDDDGATKPNPLKSAKSLYRSESLKVAQVNTRRYTSSFRGKSATLADLVEKHLKNPGLAEFTQELDNGAHGAIHIWVGGTGDPDIPNGQGDMGAVVSAAYDPLFWFHHCFIDKLWFDWHAKHQTQQFDKGQLDQPLFEGLLVKKVIDSERGLKYTYGGAVIGAGKAAAKVDQSKEEAFLPPTMRVELGDVAGGFAIAQLELQGVKPPKDSVEVRVFVGEASATSKTPTRDHPTFGGSLYLFGHGYCFGAPGHCNPDLEERDDYDLRPDHPLAKRTYRVEITGALQNALAAAGAVTTPVVQAGPAQASPAAPQIELQFVVVDADGKQVPPGVIEFDALSVITR